jgi:hypothetical protein
MLHPILAPYTPRPHLRGHQYIRTNPITHDSNLVRVLDYPSLPEPGQNLCAAEGLSPRTALDAEYRDAQRLELLLQMARFCLVDRRIGPASRGIGDDQDPVGILGQIEGGRG